MIKIGVNIVSTIDKVWELFIQPTHILKWNSASPDWHCPAASNDLVVGGHFSYTMAAKDGSFSFDFKGVYTQVVPHQQIAYTLEDGRKVITTFDVNAHGVEIIQEFEPEQMNPIDMQQAGWQAILNSFKSYVEANP